MNYQFATSMSVTAMKNGGTQAHYYSRQHRTIVAEVEHTNRGLGACS